MSSSSRSKAIIMSLLWTFAACSNDPGRSSVAVGESTRNDVEDPRHFEVFLAADMTPTGKWSVPYADDETFHLRSRHASSELQPIKDALSTGELRVVEHRHVTLDSSGGAALELVVPHFPVVDMDIQIPGQSAVVDGVRLRECDRFVRLRIGRLSDAEDRTIQGNVEIDGTFVSESRRIPLEAGQAVRLDGLKQRHYVGRFDLSTREPQVAMEIAGFFSGSPGLTIDRSFSAWLIVTKCARHTRDIPRAHVIPPPMVQFLRAGESGALDPESYLPR